MGLIKGALLFLVTSLIMTSLILGNLFLIFSLSLEENSLQAVILSDFSEVNGQNLDLTNEVENNFDSLIEHCENNTNFEFSQGDYEVDIPCEVVDQGPEAVVEEGFNDVLESAIEQQYPDSPLGVFSKLLFSSNASEYWMNYFYIVLGVLAVLISIMFFIVEEKLSIPITVGFLLILSSLPFAATNFIFPMFENSFLNPISILFAESYTVFLGVLIFGASLIIVGFGLRFFKFSWSLSEKFGKLKGLFNRKSKIKEDKKL